MNFKLKLIQLCYGALRLNDLKLTKMKIGFIRSSIILPSIEVQREALLKEGCEKIYEEKSSKKKNQKQLSYLLKKLEKDDIVIIWKFSAFGITTLELIKLINEFKEKEVHLISLNNGLNYTNELTTEELYSLTSYLTEHERDVIKERTSLGLSSLKARGRKGGRPKGLSEPAKTKAKDAIIRYNKGDSIKEIMRELKIGSKATFYRYLKYEGLKFNYNKKKSIV